MRAWSVLRQLLAATLSAVLALPASSTVPLRSSTPSHAYDAGTLSKTRVWGSEQKILLHFCAAWQLSEKQHWGYEKCSWKIVVGSAVTYDYDAFGNLIHSSFTGIPPGGTTAAPTPNEFLFAGEQFDSDLGLYYNRARYLNVSTGRFWSMDTFEGDEGEPPSLHKYTYTENDPVNGHDATGFQTEVEEVTAEAVDDVISSIEQQLRYDRILRFVRVATTGVTLLTIALTLDGDNSPTPGNRDRTKKPKMLYRNGLDWEFASDLEIQAEAAVSKDFPHGVSAFSKRPSTRTDVEEAPFDLVAAQFPVEKTGQNLFHYTIVLPHPVTDDAANRFNRLWYPPRMLPQ